MNVKLLFSGVCSACFELENSEPYFAPEKFKVLLNDQEQYECDRNVFSLYGLQPDTAYRLTVRGETGEGEIGFRTRSESCAVDVRDFGAVATRPPSRPPSAAFRKTGASSSRREPGSAAR